MSITRVQLPADRTARVRQAFLREAAVVARTRRLRRWTIRGATALAAAAAVVLAVRTERPARGVPAPPVAVAVIERVDGGGMAFRSQPIAEGQSVAAGDTIETGSRGRVGLRLGRRSVRLDRDTRVRFLSERSLELSSGAVYVDSGPDAPGLEIQTPFGRVTDVGTQFETAVGPASIRVRVRSGLVELHQGGRVVEARPGTELRGDATGTTRRTVPSFGPDWDWVSDVAPPIEMDGRSLHDFLDALCREHGWTMTYVDAPLAREAADVILHGSARGLAPADALAVALSTSGLDHRVENGVLIVQRGAP